MKYSAIVVAAGKSQRFNQDVNKLLYPLSNGSLVIDEALKMFREDNDCDQIVIVTNSETIQYLAVNRACGKESYCAGGESRSESVFNGLMAVFNEYVLVHDGARCYLGKEDLENIKEAMFQYQAALLVKDETDTVKEVKDGYIVKTIDRDRVKRALTPQGFKTDELFDCYRQAFRDGFKATDDASIVEQYSATKIRCVKAVGYNEKITTIDDIK
ncbi:MAG: IspD/TarI family cytidylyltransferase [Erysipelotrichaceae bacterium]